MANARAMNACGPGAAGCGMGASPWGWANTRPRPANSPAPASAAPASHSRRESLLEGGTESMSSMLGKGRAHVDCGGVTNARCCVSQRRSPEVCARPAQFPGVLALRPHAESVRPGRSAGGKGSYTQRSLEAPLTLRKEAGCDDPSTAKDNQFVPDHLGVAGQLIPLVASCVSSL